MTATKYTHLARAARPQLLGLMGSKVRWTDGELRAALQLDGPVLQTVLTELTAEGVIRRRFVPTAVDAVYSLSARSTGVEAHRPLSPVQQRTHAYLLGRRETVATVAAALHLPRVQVTLPLFPVPV